MNKKEIIRELIEKGIIPTPENIKKFSKEDSKVSEGDDEKTKVSLKLINEKDLLSTEDFMNFYKSRYEKIRKILLEKMEDVSINKIKNVFSEISVIGLVVEKNSNGFIIEDLTGQVEVVSKEDVSEDDVVGVKGIVREGRIFATTVVYPDVSFNREIGKIQGNMLISKNIEDIPDDVKKGFDVVITSSKKNTAGNVVSIPSNPAFLKIRKGKGKVNVLIYRPTGDEDILSLLKKRYFPTKRNQIKWNNDPFVIEDVPDIFWVISNKNEVKLHKGILITFCESAAVNLETKQVNFNLS